MSQVETHAETARQIFEMRNQQRSLADVDVVKASMWIDRGDLSLGSQAALDAYRNGRKLTDAIIVARAALELCRANWPRSERPEEEEVPGSGAHKALDWADQAIDQADGTENRRLCAKAQIWRGLVLSWRCGYECQPPALADDDPRYLSLCRDPRYRGIGAPIPKTESTRDAVMRLLPYWNSLILGTLEAGERPLIVAHGNSLRGAVKHFTGRPADLMMTWDLPTAQPYILELARVAPGGAVFSAAA